MSRQPAVRKLVSVIGARPQFIKASVVSNAIERSGTLKEVVIHTGQHFDANMSEVFFSELGMKEPRYNLDVHGGQHGEMTGRMLIGIEKVLVSERPDAVVVYGDTNSTLAGALAAVKLQIPVAHVEAGLRAFDLSAPEEVNRILTDRVARWLFTPTETAASHLRREGTEEERIIPVGDVMYDVALHHGKRVGPEGGRLGALQEQFGVKPGEYCLATLHRAVNTDDPRRLSVIVEALAAFSREVPVVWPMHPRTRAVLQGQDWLTAVKERLLVIEPASYLEMVQLEKYARLIATDSGGVQKEAFFHRVPCVTLRDETEWVELVEAGWNRLAPPNDTDTVLAALRTAMNTRGREVSPYGAGNAAELIVAHLEKQLA